MQVTAAIGCVMMQTGDQAMRHAGEYAPMDISKRTNGMAAIVRNFPIGVISMVSPFNFPLNLTAHKVAPALAVGCADFLLIIHLRTYQGPREVTLSCHCT